VTAIILQNGSLWSSEGIAATDKAVFIHRQAGDLMHRAAP